MMDDRDRPSPDWRLPPEPPLHRAARHGDLAVLQSLLDRGADINERADLEFDNGPHLNSLTSLMVAARSIDGATTETLRWLVDNGADIHARSEGGNTAAWYAAGHGGRWEFHKTAVTPDHVDRLRYLLDLGLDPHECNHVGRSLITEACSAGDLARLRLLLERGVDIHARPPNPTDKHLTDRLASITGIRILEGQRDRPFGHAGSYQIPLFCAAESGSGECVSLLLEHGVDPNTLDSSGRTALMYAASVEVARLLLDAGTDLHAVDEFGNDAFQSMMEDSCRGSVCGSNRFHVAQVLVDAGIDLERVDEYGKTRLASAAFGRHADAVDFLLKLGANFAALDSEGGTALHSICWQGENQDEETNQACERIIRALVDAGVHVNSRDESGASPLHEAAAGDWGNQTAIRTLLALGANPDLVDHEGNSPLMLAAAKGEVECIRRLLHTGADPKRTNRSGHTAMDAAKEHLHTWQSIVADGPDDSLVKQMQDIQSQLLADLHVEVPLESDDSFAGLDAQKKRHEEALREAQESLELLERAAGGT